MNRLGRDYMQAHDVSVAMLTQFRDGESSVRKKERLHSPPTMENVASCRDPELVVSDHVFMKRSPSPEKFHFDLDKAIILGYITSRTRANPGDPVGV